MVYIQVKNYEHFNRSMGKWISSKKQYDEEMKKGGYVAYEKGEQLAEEARVRNKKHYDKLSEKTMRFLNQVKDTADKKGNIPVTDRFIKGLRENGVNVGLGDRLPKHYRGGFDA
jgi:hypothetical protein